MRDEAIWRFGFGGWKRRARYVTSQRYACDDCDSKQQQLTFLHFTYFPLWSCVLCSLVAPVHFKLTPECKLQAFLSIEISLPNETSHISYGNHHVRPKTEFKEFQRQSLQRPTDLLTNRGYAVLSLPFLGTHDANELSFVRFFNHVGSNIHRSVFTHLALVRITRRFCGDAEQHVWWRTHGCHCRKIKKSSRL